MGEPIKPVHKELKRMTTSLKPLADEVKLEDEEYLVIRENELLAVVANGSA